MATFLDNAPPNAGDEKRQFRRPIVRPRINFNRGPKMDGERSLTDATDTGRLNSSWTTTPETVDSYIAKYWSLLVARSRDQTEKSDHGRKFLQLCRDNIAGPEGLSFQSQVKDPSGKADKVAGDAIEEAWREFSEVGNFDSTGTMGRVDVERLMVASLVKDGEIIMIKRRNKRLPHGYAVQIIDPIALDPAHFEKLRNGNEIKHGIEFDEFDRPVAYWFRQFTERQAGYVIGGDKYKVVAAEDVLHIFVVEIVGQKRGLPWTRSALFRIKTLGAFEDAALVNARVGASKMGFFYDEEGADPEEGEEITMDADPGVFEDIGRRKFVEWNPQFPDAAVGEFTKGSLRSIGAGLGVSFHNLANDLTSVNFSSLRQGALDEREFWKAAQSFLVRHYANRVFRDWLEMALLMEKVTVPRKTGGMAPLSILKYDKYKAATFTPRRWDWIDPVKDVEANEKAIALGIKSRSKVIRDMGGDPEATWDEIAKENEILKGLKIEVLEINAKPAKPTPQAKPSAEE